MNREPSGLPVDPWNELLHQGDVFERSVAAVPGIVAALESGTDTDAEWLYVLAAMCVGRPEELAGRIRAAARQGASVYRRLLEADDDDTRAGAVAVLAASRAVEPEDGSRFARLAAEDAATVVRAHAALALGLHPGHERSLERLLDEADLVVAHAAALALARLGSRRARVVLVLAQALVDAADSPTERPPWDELYPEWADELVELADDAHPAVPLLVDAVGRADAWLVAELVRVATTIAAGDHELRRALARRLLERDDLWKRADLEYALRDAGLPDSKKALRAWLDD